MDEDVPDRFSIEFGGVLLLGRYHVEGKIAEGGMGAVYRALDQNLGVPVVVKVPHARLLSEPGFRRRFETEIADLTQLRHPGIVPILARGAHEDVPFFVLQFMTGGSLANRIERASGGRQAPDEVAAWLRAVAGTLDFIHARGVVHRDVKPGNILFDGHDHCYLSDFGIAKALHPEASGLTTTGASVGSPAYMAPEQAISTRVTGAADQYALAATAYDALAGTPPFTGETPVAILVQKQQADAAPLRDHAPHLPAAAADVIARGLAREPGARYPTCSELARAFDAALASRRSDGEATRPVASPTTNLAGAEEPRERLGNRSRAARRPLVIGVAFAVAAVTGWFFFGRDGGVTAAQVIEARRSLESAQADARRIANAQHPAVRALLESAARAMEAGERAPSSPDGNRDAVSWASKASHDFKAAVTLDQQANLAASAREAFTSARDALAEPQLASSRASRESAERLGRSASAAFAAGRFDEARADWETGAKDAAGAAERETRARKIASAIESGRNALRPGPGMVDPPDVAVTLASLNELQRLLGADELEAAETELKIVGPKVEAAVALRVAAGRADAARARWAPVGTRIREESLYVKVRQKLLEADSAAGRALEALAAGRFEEAATGLDAALSLAEPLLKEHADARARAAGARAVAGAPPPETVASPRHAAERAAALARAETALSEGRFDDVPAAMAAARSADEAAAALAGAAATEKATRLRWAAIQERIRNKVIYDKVRVEIEKSGDAARAALVDLDSGRSSDGERALRAACATAEPLLERHDAALAAAAAARKRAGSPPSGAGARTPAGKALVEALQAMDVATGEGRFDDVEPALARAETARRTYEAALAAQKAAADLSMEAWRRLEAEVPAIWSDDVASEAGSAVAVGRSAAAAFAAEDFEAAKAKAEQAVSSLRPLLEKHRVAIAPADRARAAWTAARSRAGKALSGDAIALADGADKDFAAGRFTLAEKGYTAAAQSALRPMAAYQMPLTAPLPPGWTAEANIVVDGQGLHARSPGGGKRVSGVARSHDIPIFGDFDVVASLASDGHSGARATFTLVVRNGVKNISHFQLRSSGTLRIERRGSRVTVSVNGTPTTTDTIGADDTFKGFEIQFADSHMALTALSVTPVP